MEIFLNAINGGFGAVYCGSPTLYAIIFIVGRATKFFYTFLEKRQQQHRECRIFWVTEDRP